MANAKSSTKRTNWRRQLIKRILRSEVFLVIASRIIHAIFWFVYKTNRKMETVEESSEIIIKTHPVILAVWHGQQLLVGYPRPASIDTSGLVSRSVDAELTARVLQIMGVDVVRGSGGREKGREAEKGGVSALLSLRKALSNKRMVVMIADISKGAPRQAGAGIVTLAKISGRPIVPIAVATSNRYVVEKSWDKTTINLPFGRMSIKVGKPIYIDAELDKDDIQIARDKVTDELNKVTQEAYAAVDKFK